MKARQEKGYVTHFSIRSVIHRQNHSKRLTAIIHTTSTYILIVAVLALEDGAWYNLVNECSRESYSGRYEIGKARQEMATQPIEKHITPQAYQMCPRYEHAIQLLGKRWTGLILDSLLDGSRRFCELTATVEGLSDRVLSDRLRELEAEGIVERMVYPQIPVRVEYRLTGKGRDLKPVVQSIHEWAEHWIELPSSSDEHTAE